MRKSLSVILIAVMVTMMTVPALAIEVELPLVSEPTTFTIMVKKEDMSQNTWAEKIPVQYTEEQTGIHIEWIEVPSSGWNEAEFDFRFWRSAGCNYRWRRCCEQYGCARSTG